MDDIKETGEVYDINQLNNFISSNEFKKDDYEVVEEEKMFGNQIDTINIFMVYFKNLFQKNPSLSIFDDISEKDLSNTNRQMELLYEHMFKYKSNCDNEENVTIYPIQEFNLDECEELYSLKINIPTYNNLEYGCQYIIPLISLLSLEKWRNVEWTLTPIKRSDV
jgi:hypothetical protein